MMGAAMLKHHRFVWSLWALYRLVVSSIMWRSQAQPLFDSKSEDREEIADTSAPALEIPKEQGNYTPGS